MNKKEDFPSKALRRLPVEIEIFIQLLDENYNSQLFFLAINLYFSRWDIVLPKKIKEISAIKELNH